MKVYQESEAKQPEKKEMVLRLRQAVGDDDIELVAVNESGDPICVLAIIDMLGLTTMNCAKYSLEKHGYDTSQTRWNEAGDLRAI